MAVAAAAERRARTPAGLAVLAFALLVYGTIVSARKMGDYDVYHRAASRLVAGETVYELGDPHRYLYAPPFVFLFVPLVPVPILAGKLVWFLVNLALAVRVVRLSFRFARFAGRAPPGALVLLLALTLRFLDNNVAHGQMNLVLLWLVLEAYAAAGRERFGIAGLALAGAILTKLFPAVLLLQLALRRQWRFLLATVVGLAVVLAAPVLWWKHEYPAVLASWSAIVIDQAGHYELGNKINQSISAFAYRAFRPYPYGTPFVELPPAAVHAIVALLHAAFLLPLLRLSRRAARRGGEPPEGRGGAELGAWLLYATVLLPYSWKYYFVDLIPACAVVLRRLWSPRPSPYAWGLGVVFVLNLVAGLRLLGKPVALLFQLWSFHFLAVAVLLWLTLRAAAEGEDQSSSGSGSGPSTDRHAPPAGVGGRSSAVSGDFT